MKQTKWILFTVMILALLALACNGSVPQINTNIDPQAVASQAAQAAGTALVLGGTAAAQSGSVAATLQASGALQTAQAAVANGNVDVDSLRQKFAALQLDANGNVTVVVTDAELNQVIQAQQAQGNTNSKLQNPLVAFTGGYIILTGDVTDPITAKLTVNFNPYVSNGLLQFDVVSASVGQVNVPPSLLDSAEATLNNTLGDALSQLPAGVSLKSVVMGEGTMTITAGKS